MTYGTLISTQTVGAGGAASIDFTSIPQTYTDLLIVYSLRDNLSGISNDATFTVNGSLITFRQLYGTGTNVGSNNPAQIARPIVSGTGPANTFGNTQIYIANYSSTTRNKSITVDSVCENNASESYQVFSAGVLASTSAVTSVSLDNSTYNFTQYSTASIYGINPITTASLGTTPTVDYLVVAGGGGGGSRGGAGAGAGGLLTGSSFAVTSGSVITVTVGAGGTGSTNGATNQPGTAGSNSVFSSITANGGGYGAGEGGNGGNGGSGGGAGTNNPTVLTAGTGIAGQGYAGGTNSTASAGGGGGAGAAGSNAVTATGGAGGVGALNTYNGFSQYYAGGGGGGSQGTSGGAGGTGGGGNGGLTTTSTGIAGTANTGGGGGGGGAAAGTGYAGGNGGSGVVVIRYPQTYNPPSVVTGNPAVNYINGYRVYTWTNSGSVIFGTPVLASSGLVLNLDASNTSSYPGTGTTWYDLSGNGNNATFGTGQSYDSANGGSIAFAGNGVATVAHSSSLNISTAITVGVWVYYISGAGRIIQKDSDSLTRLWEMGGNNGFRIEMWHSNGNTTGAITANALTTNGWMYLTMVFDGTNLYQYQNATLTKTTAFAGDIRTATTPLYLGGFYGTTEWLTGKIGAAHIYNRALSAEEVNGNFNAQRTRFGI
jgi:hypothetical protein